MKLSVENTPVESGGLLHQGEFRIKNSAKAFSILSSGLYSNKFQAILRELGCNAYDSHVEAGKATVPFTVRLPTKINPIFSVRDYGIGLDNEGVIDIYTTYFESTKQNSNDYVGCMGLGSKSPFSYTDTFTITAIKNGVKRQYTAFINEQGIPAIARLHEEPTTECNGVEVSFAVNNQNDMWQFSNEAKRVFSWFKIKPKIIGQEVLIPEIEYAERDIVPGVHVRKDNGSYHHSNGSYALMGNVAYPIKLASSKGDDDDDDDDDDDGEVRSAKELRRSQIRKILESGNLVIEFKIGELDVAASREELSYIPHTVNTIYARGEEIIEQLSKYIEKELSTAKTKWDRTATLVRLHKSNANLFGPSLIDYVAKHKDDFFKYLKIDLYQVRTYVGLEELQKVRADIADWMSYYHLDTSYGANAKIKASRVNGHAASIPGAPKVEQVMYNGTKQYVDATTTTYEVGDGVTFLFQNDRGGVIDRIKAAYEQRKIGREVMVFRTPKGLGDEARDFMHKQLIHILGNPSKVVYTSSLPKVKKEGYDKTQMVAYRYEEGSRRGYYDDGKSYKFTPSYDVENELDYSLEKDKIFLYVPLMNSSVQLGDNEQRTSTPNDFHKSLEKGNIPQFLGVDIDTIYGLNKTTRTHAKNLKGWVNLYDYLRKKVLETDWKAVRETIRRRYIADQVCNGDYNLSKVDARTLQSFKDEVTPFGKMVALYLEHHKNKKEVLDYESVLKFLIDLGGSEDDLKKIREIHAEININKIDKELSSLMDQVKNRYPMLKHLDLGKHSYASSEHWKEAITYIRLVDSVKA